MRKISWVEVARRGKSHAVLFIFSVMELYRQGYFGRAHGIKWNPQSYRQFDQARWFGQDDVDQYQKFIEQASHKSALFTYATTYEKRVQKFIEFAKSHSDKDFTKTSDKQLEKIVRRWYEHNKKMWSFAYDYIYVNKFMPDLVTSAVAAKLQNAQELNSILGVLFEADSPSEVRMEKKSLVKLAVKIKKQHLKIDNRLVTNAIMGHLQKFRHLGLYYFRGKPYTSHDIQNRLKEYISKPLRFLEQSLQDFALQTRNKQRTNALVKKLKLDKQTIHYIKTIKRWGTLSNFADESYGYTVFALWPLWLELERRLGITHAQLLCMTADEVCAALQDKKITSTSKKILQERERDNAVILQEGKTVVLSGTALTHYSKEHQKQELKITKTSELTGQAASPGKVSGKVRLVFSSHDVKKVERDDILVASSTNPTYVPAMERAAAIVTDEGGLLSHAAIVSRELKIPCVVGTLIATKIFKDGDVVEVDANKGIVRRI